VAVSGPPCGLDPKATGYERYGGRGITICDRWRGDQGFENFLADMGERPPNTSLDRINNDGNYELGNCRWATQTTQVRNSRVAKLTMGRVLHIRRLAAEGKTRTEIAKNFGISSWCVGQIAANKTWQEAAIA